MTREPISVSGSYCHVRSLQSVTPVMTALERGMPHPIRIAFCITELDPGGAERALVRLACGLPRSNWECRVYCLGPPAALVAPLRAAGISVVCLNARGVRDFGVVERLAGELRQFQPALLQTFLFHANFLGRLAGWAAGVPVIVAGIRVAQQHLRWRLWLDRATDYLVTRHVCVSEDVARFSEQTGGLPGRKLVVIPNGVDVEMHALADPLELAEFGIPPGSRCFLYVGRLDPQKGIFNLLKAMRQIGPQHRDVHLLLAGTGPQRGEIESWIANEGLGARIHLVGWRDDVPRLLRSADCLVLPSQWEGLPNVVLEAMAAALPVIATSVEGISTLVQPGKTGLLVPPGNPTELARAMDGFLTNPEGVRSWGVAGQRFVSAHFTWSRMIERYAQLYVELIMNSALRREFCDSPGET